MAAFSRENRRKSAALCADWRRNFGPCGILKPAEGYVVEKFGGLADTLYIYRNGFVHFTNAYVRAAARTLLLLAESLAGSPRLMSGALPLSASGDRNEKLH